MAGFGGAVKLTGESEYRKALSKITQNLKEVSSEMKLVSAQYDSNDSSIEALTAKQDVLNKKLEQQTTKVSTLKKQYADMAAQYDVNKAKNEALAKKYDEEKNKLANLGSSLGENSTAYKNQAKAVEDLEKSLEKSEKAQEANAKTMSNLKIKVNEAEAEMTKTSKEVDKLAEEMKDCAKDSNSLSKELKNASNSTESAKGGFTVLKATMADLVAEGIKQVAIGLKDLVNDSSKAFSQFSASTGVATDAMGEYKEAIEDVYKSNFGESLEDVANSMAKVKEVTGELDASALEEMTEKAITLEDTFGMDMTETLRGVQSLVTHFGISSSEAFDLLSAGAQNGLNYTDELGDNISEYAGKFAEAGYSTEEYFQLLQNGSQGGAYNLDKVNDAINEVTTRLADGTIEDGLASFSESTQEVFKNWQDGKATQKDVINSIVADIQSATGEQEKMNMSALAFGTMAEDGGTKFIQSLTAVGDTYTDVQGKADELANTKYDTPVSSIQEVGRTLQTDLLMPIVNEIMPVINEFISAVSTGVQWLIDNGATVTAVITGIATATGAYLAYTTALKVMQEGWTALTVVTKAQSIAQAALNAVMSANPIGLVIAAIAGLVVGFVTLWNKSEAFRNFWIELWENIKAIVEPIIEGIVTAFSNAWDSIKAVWDTVSGFFSDLWGNISNTFSNVKSFFSDKFNDAWNAVKQIFSNVGGFFGGIWNTIRDKFSSLGTNIGDAIGGAVKSGINSVIGLIEGTINNAIKLINGAIGLINKLPGVSVGKVANVSLPRLARGGVVNGATVAEIGEAGAEAVVPLENNTQWITKVAEQMAKALITPISNAARSATANVEATTSAKDTVEAFKEALGQMKIVLDDEEMGHFVEKTVADAIYT